MFRAEVSCFFGERGRGKSHSQTKADRVADHPQDENSAPNQQDDKADVADAHLAKGVTGAEPPPEERAPKAGKRDLAAAGLSSIWETVRRGAREMGVKRSLKTLLNLNQKDGFDCPSCAWPDPDDDRKTAEFCENGAKAVADEATRARITPEFFAQHSIAELLQQSDFWLDKPGPPHRTRWCGARAPIATSRSPWDEAFALVAGELNALASPDEASFYTSGRASNEAAFLYGLFVRQFGTNNLPDCSNMCHESSGLGLTETIGIGKSTVKIEDFSYADSIFIIGQNPGTCHPRMLTELQKAAQQRLQDRQRQPAARDGDDPLQEPAGAAVAARPGDGDRLPVSPGAGQRRRRALQGDHEGDAGGRSRRRRQAAGARLHRAPHRGVRGAGARSRRRRRGRRS